jgi:hypothetical protein
LGAFNPKLEFTPDWEMWLRISAAYDVGYLATPYAAYREHTRNATLEFNRRVIDLQDQAAALQVFFAAHPTAGGHAVDAFAALGKRAREQVLTCLRDGDAEHSVGYARLAAEMDVQTEASSGDVSEAALLVLAEQGATLGRAHQVLEKWALELEAELKRRDAVPNGASSRLKKALQELTRLTE